MKIAINYTDVKDSETITIVEATYVSNYVIELVFNDGVEKMVDFEPFLIKSQHPSIVKYLELVHFKNFKIIDGNLNWNDYDLIFPVWDLYEGKISA